LHTFAHWVLSHQARSRRKIRSVGNHQVPHNRWGLQRRDQFQKKRKKDKATVSRWRRFRVAWGRQNQGIFGKQSESDW